LKKRLAVYETPKDSHNSSIPPTKDTLAVQATMAKYASCIQAITYKRLTEVLCNCFGVALSQGTVDNVLKDMSDKSLEAYDEIRNKVE